MSFEKREELKQVEGISRFIIYKSLVDDLLYSFLANSAYRTNYLIFFVEIFNVVY